MEIDDANSIEDSMLQSQSQDSYNNERENELEEDNSVEMPNEFDPSYPQCYCGSPRTLGSIELQCWFCIKWFHAECVQCTVPNKIPFLTNYVFNCKSCAPNKVETLQMKSASFSQMCHTALCNLTYREQADGGSELMFSKEGDIIPYIEKNWELLTTAPRRVKQTWHNTIHKTLLKDTDLFIVSEPVPGDFCFSLVNQHLFKVGPSFEALRGTFVSATASKSGAQCDTRGRGAKRKTPFESNQLTRTKRSDVGSTIKQSIHGYPLDHPSNKDGYRYILAESDPHAPNRQAFDDSADWAGKPIPGYLYRMFQAPKVLLALHDKATQLKISDDRLSVTGEKGYCMVRATHSVRAGAWYFEIKIDDMPHDTACRLGWSQALGNLQAPCGYDKFSYSYRSRKGTRFHQSKGQHYGEGYGTGDVVGVYISLPTDDISKLLPPTYKDLPLVKFKNHLYFEEKDYLTETEKNIKPNPRTKIAFFKNGIQQGVAFEDIFEGTYYPGISFYKNVSATANFGPDFKYPPEKISEYKPMSQASRDAIVDYALADIVYILENEDTLPKFT